MHGSTHDDARNERPPTVRRADDATRPSCAGLRTSYAPQSTCCADATARRGSVPTAGVCASLAACKQLQLQCPRGGTSSVSTTTSGFTYPVRAVPDRAKLWSCDGLARRRRDTPRRQHLAQRQRALGVGARSPTNHSQCRGVSRLLRLQPSTSASTRFAPPRHDVASRHAHVPLRDAVIRSAGAIDREDLLSSVRVPFLLTQRQSS